jgi:hypothetical protein
VRIDCANRKDAPLVPSLSLFLYVLPSRGPLKLVPFGLLLLVSTLGSEQKAKSKKQVSEPIGCDFSNIPYGHVENSLVPRKSQEEERRQLQITLEGDREARRRREKGRRDSASRAPRTRYSSRYRDRAAAITKDLG